MKKLEIIFEVVYAGEVVVKEFNKTKKRVLISTSGASFKKYGEHNALMIKYIESGRKDYKTTKTVLVTGEHEYKVYDQFMYPSKIKKIPGILFFFYIEDFNGAVTSPVFSILTKGVYIENKVIAYTNKDHSKVWFEEVEDVRPIEEYAEKASDLGVLKGKLCGKLKSGNFV